MCEGEVSRIANGLAGDFEYGLPSPQQGVLTLSWRDAPRPREDYPTEEEGYPLGDVEFAEDKVFITVREEDTKSKVHDQLHLALDGLWARELEPRLRKTRGFSERKGGLREAERNARALVMHAAVLAKGHKAKDPYSWEMRSPNAWPELAPGPYWNQIVIFDSNESWRIRDRLKRECGWE
jgi:hypothetical protein